MCNDARTSRSKRDLVPRQRREQHQHAHCAQQARPPLLSRTASRACTLTAPGLSVRTVLRVVAVDLLRPRRLAADRAADGLHERCDIRATVDLPSTTSSASRPACRMRQERRRSHQRDDRDSTETSSRASNRHLPEKEPKGLLCVFALGCSTKCVFELSANRISGGDCPPPAHQCGIWVCSAGTWLNIDKSSRKKSRTALLETPTVSV